MSGVSIVATIIVVALNIFVVIMWARFILDLARAFARNWRPRGLGLVLAEVVFSVTDPPIKLVRRVIPPLRIGGAALDFASGLSQGLYGKIERVTGKVFLLSPAHVVVSGDHAEAETDVEASFFSQQ